MKDALFIINPAAGRGGYKYGLAEALNTLSRGGIRPSICFTRKSGDATRFAAEDGGKYDLVCCLGGDGTLSEVVSGLMRVNAPPPIGYIPLGTANDIAATLGLPKNVPSAARIIAGGNTQSWDVGSLGGIGHFAYVAAFGAFTDVSYETRQDRKQVLGQFAYLLEGLTRLTSIPHYRTRVEFDGETKEADYVFGGVLNSTSVGGLVHLDPAKVKLDDGKFEVVLVKNPGNLVDLNKLIGEILVQKYDGDYFEIFQTGEVRFVFNEPVPLTRDGEGGGSFSDVTMTNIPRAMRILVP